VLYTAVELGFRTRGTAQRHVSIAELGNGELFMDFIAWEVAGSAATAVEGKKQAFPTCNLLYCVGLC